MSRQSPLSPKRVTTAGPKSEEMAVPQESLQLQAPTPPQGEAAPLQKQSGKLMQRVLASLGLGLVVVSLAGCNLEGAVGPITPPPNQNQEQQTTAASYGARLDQLRRQPDKQDYFKMAEAGYHQAMLQRLAEIQDPAAKPIQELASKALAAFDFNGDSAVQQKLMRDVMLAIANMKSEAPQVVRYTQAAKASLHIGQSFFENAPKASEWVGQFKVKAYEPAMKTALEKLKAAPDQLQSQSGYDPALIRNYVESLSMGPELVMEFAPKLKDQGLASVLYEQTADLLYQQVKTDQQVLGGQVTTALELIHNLRKQFGI